MMNIGYEERSTIPIEPEPEHTQTYPAEVGGVKITGIRQDWRPGEGSLCRRCDVCTLRGDTCFMLVIGAIITPEDAIDFGARGLPINKAHAGASPPRSTTFGITEAGA